MGTTKEGGEVSRNNRNENVVEDQGCGTKGQSQKR